jgi:hypothetical protein
MGFLSAPVKGPGEILDYDVTFAAWVTSPATIQSGGTGAVLDGLSEPGGLSDLTIDDVVVAADIVVVWVSGGTEGETYIVKVTAVDNNSTVRTVVRHIKFKVKKK